MAVDFVYADCAASAPVLPVAMEALGRYANPNSSQHTPGRTARKAIEYARDIIADCIHAEPQQIAFTPSATAANQYAVKRFDLFCPNPHDHKSLYEPCKENAKLLRNAQVDNSAVSSVPLVSNETGRVYIDHIQNTRKFGTPVFTDATAAMGHMPVDVQALDVIGLSAGGHKFGAYPGIGFIYVRDGVTDDETFPGTPPVGLAVAMAEALAYRMEHLEERMVYLLDQRMALIEGIMTIPDAHINALGKLRLPNIISVRFDGVNARELLTALDVRGVFASAGAACSADSDKPSRVLLASGLTEEQALSTIRLSFCEETQPEEFVFVLDTLRQAVSQLRASSR